MTNSYRERQAKWEQAFDSIGAKGWIYPWINNLQEDYNPIFSAWCPEQKRAIRVIQFTEEEAEPGDILFAYWTDNFGEMALKYANDFPKDQIDVAVELVIDCICQPEYEAKAIELIKTWVLDDANQNALDLKFSKFSGRRWKGLEKFEQKDS